MTNELPGAVVTGGARGIQERAEIILDRRPFNIIVMPQRDQLRWVSEALAADGKRKAQFKGASL